MLTAILVGAGVWCLFGIVSAAAGAPGLGAFFLSTAIIMAAGVTGF